MVHRKYIKVNGKTYGPYLYESYRENGKVKKKYIGSSAQETGGKGKLLTFTLLILLGLIAVIVLGLYVNHSLTGKSINEVPSGSENGISSSVSEEESTTNTGENVEQNSQDSQESNGGGNEEVVVPSESSAEVTQNETENLAEEPTLVTDNNETVITLLNESEGNETVINPGNESEGNETENNQTILNQTTSSDILNQSILNESEMNETLSNETIINLNQTTSIIQINDFSNIKLSKNANITLNMGEYFSGAENYELATSDMNYELSGDFLTIIPHENFTGVVLAYIIARNGSEELKGNNFSILVSARMSISIERSNITLNEPVKWTQNITLMENEKVIVSIPQQAENITVTQINDEETTETEIESTSFLTGNVITRQEKGNNIFSKIGALFDRIFSSITGRVVDDTILNESFVENVEVVTNDQNESNIEVTLSENASSYIIEYYTPGPQTVETEFSNKKRVQISAPEELNYTEIYSYANVSEKRKIGEEDRIKLYWLENNSYIDFAAYDLDFDGYIDYIEWITPHLSNQTFDIILISKAEHLDENRTFITDVYDLVKEQDGNYTLVNTSQYLRITFEHNLTNTRDITLYARAKCADNSTILVNGIDVPCEIYQKKLRLDALRGAL